MIYFSLENDFEFFRWQFTNIIYFRCSSSSLHFLNRRMPFASWKCHPLSGKLLLDLFRGLPILLLPKGNLSIAILNIRFQLIWLFHPNSHPRNHSLMVFFLQVLLMSSILSLHHKIFSAIRTIFISVVSTIYRVLEVSNLVIAA